MASLGVIGFGLVALSALFLVFVFFRAWRDDGFTGDGRYKLAAGALAFGKVGIFLWALNPLSAAFYGTLLPLWLRVLASAMVLCAAIALIGSTWLGGDRRTLSIFVVFAAIWTAFCILSGAEL
jgi:hypothetical protein